MGERSGICRNKKGEKKEEEHTARLRSPLEEKEMGKVGELSGREERKIFCGEPNLNDVDFNFRNKARSILLS